jgi:type IV fimbrial biogenesis protein FimT
MQELEAQWQQFCILVGQLKQCPGNVMKRESGFTLAQVLIVISIIATLSAAAVPGLVSWLPSYRLSSAARDVLSALDLARLTAVRENAGVAVIFTAANGSYLLFVDNGEGGGVANDLTPNGSERTVRAGHMPSSVAISSAVFGASAKVGFNGIGLPFRLGGSPGGGSVVLTNSKGKALTIVLNIGGNARIQ